MKEVNKVAFKFRVEKRGVPGRGIYSFRAIPGGRQGQREEGDRAPAPWPQL